MKKLLVTCAFLVLQLSGCSTESKLFSATGYDKRTQHDAEQKLAEAATSISKSLTELAAIEKSSRPKSKLFSPLDPQMIGMDQATSIDWSGPVEPLVKKLAGIANYRLKILGKAPGIPVLISISAKDTAVADILRDVNFQCASKANIEIYPASKIVELRYTK